MAGKGKKQGQGPELPVPGSPGRAAEQSQIDFEVDFFRSILERYPDYVDVLRVLGNNLTLKGRIRDGLELDKRLVRLRPSDALAHYNLACSHSLLRQTDPALTALRRAIELGYRDFRYMKQDRDLDAIRTDPRYRAMLKEFEDGTPREAQAAEGVATTFFRCAPHESRYTGENGAAFLPVRQRDFAMTATASPPLFADPSANHLREAFRAKSRALTDKLMTVAEAVGRFVKDDDYLAIGGFGTNRIPTAVCHEILRQNKQNLAFAGHTATHDFQILCAGNLTGRGKLLSRLDAAYVVGLEARGLSPHARRVIESGEVECTEWSNFALAVRLRAAAAGVPFLPARMMLGTDTFRRSAAKEITCPFTGEKLLALPALSPDAAAIHVHEADRYGNCRLRGVNVADSDLARASKRVIITCERLIPNDEIRRDPTATVIPFFCVDAVCEVPYGSYPGNMAYEYFSDEEHLRKWLAVEEDLDEFKRFVEEAVLSKKDFGEYLTWCGGLERMQQLRQQELLLHQGR